ncbi:Rid family hydrolase [Mesorhizobium sp. CAU 1741]|uniref:Rid family hydrolase n=1 Tax=Mesorhizobium sp. CAU 1741 TaxID=3140366 RepID=UPI00325B5E61
MMTPSAQDINTSLIRRFGVGKRGSLAVTANGLGAFAVTPDAPYDGGLTTAVQFSQLLSKARGRLDEIDSGKDRLMFAAILLTDMNDLDAVNAVWDKWVSDVQPPARACFEARLAHRDLKVEMIVICVAD